MMQILADNEVRCFCNRRPLIAKWSTDTQGRPFLHIKVYKQKRIYAEVIVQGGNTLRIRCRECLRWHTFNVIEESKVEHRPEDLPETIPTSRT